MVTISRLTISAGIVIMLTIAPIGMLNERSEPGDIIFCPVAITLRFDTRLWLDLHEA